MTGNQLVQGRYAVAWVGVEPTTFKAELFSLSHGALSLNLFGLARTSLGKTPDGVSTLRRRLGRFGCISSFVRPPQSEWIA